MAFDLLKLQLLQEALDRISTGRSSICSGLLQGVYAIADADKSYLEKTFYLVPEVMADIAISVAYREGILDLAPDSNGELEDLYYAINHGYLWPVHEEFIADRVKYLERLIEDEMSGTYSIHLVKPTPDGIRPS